MFRVIVSNRKTGRKLERCIAEIRNSKNNDSQYLYINFRTLDKRNWNTRR
jgi:hypothetical protein